MTIDTHKTVGEIATAVPHAIEVFEELGIDYSTRGTRSLRDACDWEGLETDEVIEQLETAGKNTAGWRDPKSMTMSELIQDIITDHHHLESDQVRKVGRQIVKVRDAHRNDYPQLKRVHRIFADISDTIVRHMVNEERELFGRIERLELAAAGDGVHDISLKGPVLVEYVEHDAMAERFKKIRQITSNFAVPPGACTGYATLMGQLHEFERQVHRHMHLENNVLFPRALEVENAVKNGSAAARTVAADRRG